MSKPTKKNPDKKASDKQIVYTRGPNIKGHRIKDDLPPPGSFRFREADVEINLSLGEDSLSIIRQQAQRLKKPPEAVMASVLNAYAEGLR